MENYAYHRNSYHFPPIELLNDSPGSSSDGKAEIELTSRLLSDALASFHIDAQIAEVTQGPRTIRYEIVLAKGVRLKKLTGCADDIAMILGVSGVRIAAVPGKFSTVGIDVPIAWGNTVSLREVIASSMFENSESKSTFAIGKDPGGTCIIGDISQLTHMLIAGITGSGKSVCMHSIILSLLYKSPPEDVRLVMFDSKMVELGKYNGIPHLLIPVVTDPKKAAGALQWADWEMNRRYKMMSDLGVRNLASYNSIVLREENGQKLPQIVILIDDLADLMLVAAKEVEESICHIAQNGRAAGIHLIITTQQVSGDGITDRIKACIPSRITFRLNSATESRIVLNAEGAERLWGRGDMLYAPIGIGKPKRVQGCFVTDKEVERVSKFVKDNSNAEYDSEIQKGIDQLAAQAGKESQTVSAEPELSFDELGGDELLPAAVEVVLETGQASVSMLQRRLKLGYARTARIVDEMEEKGIVGPFQGSKPRAILMTKEQWAAIQGNSETLLDNTDCAGKTSESQMQEKHKAPDVGDSVTFGHYSQNIHAISGEKAIEWLVLDKQDGKLLLLSRYAVACQPFHNDNRAVTWETCSLRKWLNDSFLYNAFTARERTMIAETRVIAGRNPKYDTDPGNTTEDRLFLLSTDEATGLFASDKARRCASTAYAKAQGAYTSSDSITARGEAACWWWLRSPGHDQYGASYVEYNGTVDSFGDAVNYDTGAVRPACWVNSDATPLLLHSADDGSDEHFSLKNLLTAQVGCYVNFGSYEQYSSTSSKKEPIEWLVLERTERHLLLVSRYGLDTRSFHPAFADKTWETSSLRTWLNDSFLNTAFTVDEQSLIATTHVSANRNPEHDTSPGNATQDMVFLLSIEEVSRLFASDHARMCAPTAYAKAQGVLTDSFQKTADGNPSCCWWLRSPGCGQVDAAHVRNDGSICCCGHRVNGSYVAVRPAIRIDLDAISSNLKVPNADDSNSDNPHSGSFRSMLFKSIWDDDTNCPLINGSFS